MAEQEGTAAGLSSPYIRQPIARTPLMIGIMFVGIIAYFVLPVAPLPQVDYVFGLLLKEQRLDLRPVADDDLTLSEENESLLLQLLQDRIDELPCHADERSKLFVGQF